jgi:hypothetical protein
LTRVRFGLPAWANLGAALARLARSSCTTVLRAGADYPATPLPPRIEDAQPTPPYLTPPSTPDVGSRQPVIAIGSP